MTDSSSEPDRPYVGMTVLNAISKKGGPGKTEFCDVAEALFTLGGSKCLLVDADDGNSGLVRRVGADHETKVSWELGAQDAANWLSSQAGSCDRIIFDLGAGIDSADMTIMSFLGTVWKLLHQGGARIIFVCVVSTNAPVAASFVERTVVNYGRFGEVVILANDQDGSRSFPVELEIRPEPRLQLRKSQAGVQTVRLMRKAPLSAIVMDPSPGYGMATAMMAARLLALARQPVIRDLVAAAAVEKLRAMAASVRPLFFSIANSADAADDRLALNADLAAAHQRLLAPDASDQELVSAATNYRQKRLMWNAAATT